MPFCSFKVRSPRVCPVPGQRIALDQGINVFNAEVPDLEAFKSTLIAAGIEVLEVYRLDDHEPLADHETTNLQDPYLLR